MGKIVAIESDKYCVRLFKSVNNLFNYPLPSAQVGIHVVKSLDNDRSLTVGRDEFLHKYYGFPYKNDLVVIKIL